MDAASLALAIIGLIDVCHRYGSRLVRLCRQYRNISAELDETILAIQGSWLKMETQLRTLTALWNTLHPALQTLYHNVLTRLETNLVRAYESFEVIQARRDVAVNVRQRLKVVYLQRRLERTVQDLEEWQKRFYPSWYLITRICESGWMVEGPSGRLARMREVRRVDLSSQSGGESIFKDAATVMEKTCAVQGTNSYIAQYKNTGHHVLLDPANLTGRPSTTSAKLYVRDLARLLLHIDPMTFNLLRCDGVLEVATAAGPQFHLIFSIPSALSSPQTLRSLLASSSKCTLGHRFTLAKQLARSVMFVHVSGFVHKNIRPETVLIFADSTTTGTKTPGPSFLIRFERTRKAEGRTDKFGDLEWEKNIYRRPLRQNLQPEDIFEMRHDTYSLGVCLLEIGLWHSFVQLEEEGGCTFVPWSVLGIEHAVGDKDQRRGAFAIQERLVALAKEEVSALVGERYTGVVVACLCCLNKSEDNSFRSEKMQDEDGIIVGVRYIENVLLKLEELVV
ncbi:hypothetical protein BDW62DRAFT_211882 [Aspergillus aurantiobrunneus]